MVYIKATLNIKIDHLYGKTKRFVSSLIFPVDPNRTGECKNCGACCKFLLECPFLISDTDSPSGSKCAIYELRPLQCRKYPRTESEQLHKPCGYYFIEASGNESLNS